MYAVKASSSKTLTVTGTPTALPKAIILADGWNFLPCPYSSVVPLAGHVPTFSYAQGDAYKSQLQFAEYYSGYGWFGTLTTLQPGLGYKAKVRGGGPACFSFGQPC
jgi:hypothetical protein